MKWYSGMNHEILIMK